MTDFRDLSRALLNSTLAEDFEPGSPLLSMLSQEVGSPSLSFPQNTSPQPNLPSSSSSDMGEKRSERWLPCTATTNHITELVEDGQIP